MSWKIIDIVVNWEKLHTFEINPELRFSFRFTAILKIQCSLSVRSLNFLIASENWFSDRL